MTAPLLPVSNVPTPGLLAWTPGERHPAIDALRVVTALPLRVYLRLYHRLEMVGREHLPRVGSFVMVANHASHLDALCLLAALPLGRLGRAYPAAAEDYFFASGVRAAAVCILTNAVPFARKAHPRRGLSLCRRLLGIPGSVVILFPEGTRTKTGQLRTFCPGIGALLAGLNVPVVPCGITGTFDAWPKGSSWPRPRKVRLVVGYPRNYAALPAGRDSGDRIAAELHQAVGELLCR